MREAVESPFMALLTELRCHIYSYLPDTLYERIFPEFDMCRWEVYEMPTALMQLNKNIYQEVKDLSIQKSLQKFNDQLPPKIAIGPTGTKMESVYIKLSETLHRAGKELHTFFGEPQHCEDEIKNTSIDLSSWYNNTYLPQVALDEYEAFDTQTECRPEHLYKSVKQTLKRMECLISRSCFWFNSCSYLLELLGEIRSATPLSHMKFAP
ncbi:hypothetical protein COCCADRAFT_27735 [Bipolaris zeicola 26-R-13]|uniref:Uncharacterized protein n=1 Tax=Cochliobolus carbonum (strain 26-R-13) TaxID=930089 RepID=W6YJW2_COCC2|nr:uncharacterized protein COCCADRAFT_27735 [Bipolaris zeicola 26-R-13]EUC31571.1 hypothetical protein COCCADRAFT_27735 [Bipolaris zeicola 26-R-13]